MALLKLTIRYHLLKVEVDIVKDIVYTKMKILPSVTQPHVVISFFYL